MEQELRPYLDHVFIDLSKRSIKLVDSDGFESDPLDFGFDLEGAQGFTAAVTTLAEELDTDMITYLFAEQ
tara:strand:- start:332 stop:541 length:210 start_codon:yes stop_codon:yes gene_type:complete